MTGLLRPITSADFDAVLAWNLADVEFLAPLDKDRLEELLEWAETGSIITQGGADVGFVITIADGSAYDSANYRWFARRHPHFLYLDRIVIDPSARRAGVASAVYDEVEQRSTRYGSVLCLEVNLVPPNRPSLDFHRHRGFVEVGQLAAPDHVVSLLEKQIPGTSNAR